MIVHTAGFKVIFHRIPNRRGQKVDTLCKVLRESGELLGEGIAKLHKNDTGNSNHLVGKQIALARATETIPSFTRDLRRDFIHRVMNDIKQTS